MMTSEPWLIEVEASAVVRTAAQELSAFQETCETQGTLISPTVAARLLCVSHQRVSELRKDRQLAEWTFFGTPWVSARQVVDRLENPRPIGRPKRAAA